MLPNEPMIMGQIPASIPTFMKTAPINTIDAAISGFINFFMLFCVNIKKSVFMQIVNHNQLFNQILKIAEEMFGKRIPSQFYGVRIYNVTKPELKPFEDGYIIALTPNCENDKTRSIFQIAHEVIHLLFTSKKDDINYLEEGFAVWFSLYCLNKLALPFYSEYLNSITDAQDKYSDAYNFFNQIPNKLQFIKNLKNSEPDKQISLCDSKELNAIIGNSELSDSLAKKFYTSE